MSFSPCATAFTDTTRLTQPFSLSEAGEIIDKYGEQYKITVDLKSLDKAIAPGEVPGVQIIQHEQVLQMITDSKCAPYSKKLAMSYATKKSPDSWSNARTIF